MSDRRDELLERSLDYLLHNGVAGLSLRPLAEGVGTSARLLVYHFGSKDGLIAAVIEEVRSRLQASFAAALERSGTGTGPDVLRSFWAWTTAASNVPYLRLLFEVQILAIQNPATYARYLDETTSSWLELIERALPASKRDRATATLAAAVVDGLILEYLSTGDLDRTTHALELFARLVTGEAATRRGASSSARGRR